jgi:hypothetical protein
MMDYNLYEKDHTRVKINTSLCVLFILTCTDY